MGASYNTLHNRTPATCDNDRDRTTQKEGLATTGRGGGARRSPRITRRLPRTPTATNTSGGPCDTRMRTRTAATTTLSGETGTTTMVRAWAPPAGKPQHHRTWAWVSHHNSTGKGWGGGGTAADMPWQLAQDSMASSAPVPVCHYLGEGRKRRPAGLSAAGGNMQGIDRGIVRGSPGASRASGKKMDGGGAQQASQEAGVRGVLLPVLCAVAGPGPSPSRVYQRMTPRRAGAGTPAAVRRRRPSTPG